MLRRRNTIHGNSMGHESSVGVDVVVVWWVWVFGAPTAHWRVWVFGASTAQWWVWVFGASTAKDPRSKIAAGHVGVVLQTSSCQAALLVKGSDEDHPIKDSLKIHAGV
ncbi:TPA: hypothetical protein ACH3X3_010530 [Trebouxia sp. C0006]